MTPKEAIDTAWQQEVTCPYCGHVSTDSYEYFLSEDPATIECDDCAMEFEAFRNVTITYTTYKKVTP